jgi:hypothetical protein
MKYISKNIQKYLTTEQKEDYKKIKKDRNEFIKNNPLFRVQMYSRYNKKTWYAVPNRRSVWYIKNPSEKQDVKNYFESIKAFDKKIVIIERNALENKEALICKTGNMLTGNVGWWRKANVIVQEKESRDYYSLLFLDNMKSRSFKWKDVVMFFDLSEVSK